MGDIDKLRGRAERLRGRVEQAVGRATGSKTTQARGVIDEAKGTALEALADIKGEVKKGAGEAQKRLAEINGTAKATLTGLDFAKIAVGVVGAFVAIAIFRALSFGRQATQPLPETTATSS